MFDDPKTADPTPEPDPVITPEPEPEVAVEQPEAKAEEKPEEKAGPKPVVKTFSAIQFPYSDLDAAISVARALFGMGGGPCEKDQLAAAMGQPPTSGSFGTKLSSARLFGLVDVTQGRIKLSELGYAVLEPGRDRAAKAQAFLNVPLYRKTYEHFKGKQLPPRSGLETTFVEFGVSPKQKENARYMFDRSARTAGYFPTPQEDRLVAPVIVDTGPTATLPDPASGNGDIGASTANEQAQPVAENRTKHHALIEGLLEELPREKPFSLDDQVNWLQAAAQIFKLLYKERGAITVTGSAPAKPQDPG